MSTPGIKETQVQVIVSSFHHHYVSKKVMVKGGILSCHRFTDVESFAMMAERYVVPR